MLTAGNQMKRVTEIITIHSPDHWPFIFMFNLQLTLKLARKTKCVELSLRTNVFFKMTIVMMVMTIVVMTIMLLFINDYYNHEDDDNDDNDDHDIDYEENKNDHDSDDTNAVIPASPKTFQIIMSTTYRKMNDIKIELSIL